MSAALTQRAPRFRPVRLGRRRLDDACTDDGSVTVTLSVDDGVNPPATDTTTLTLTNALPDVGIDEPVDGSTHPLGTSVEPKQRWATPA